LGLELGFATYGLGLELDTPELDFFDFLVLIFKVFLHFSLMENPDCQSEILKHPL